MQRSIPLSLGTLALVCDEKVIVFMAPTSPSGVLENNSRMASRFSCNYGISEVYMGVCYMSSEIIFGG